MMPDYRLADVSAEQLTLIESLENEIGLTLVAYEPEGEPGAAPGAKAAADAGHGSATGAVAADANDRLLDALVDTYRTYDPYI